MTATHVHHHPHTADHEHPAHEPVNAESYPHVRGGPQVLDIGGDIGALDARMPADAAGTELYLRSEHEPPIEIHAGVWHRSHAENALTSAVFAELLAGTYLVLDSAGAIASKVVIRGGELSQIDLR
ncbi:MAG: hypothetical protein ABJD68_12365 [Nakamurella sp.]